MIKNRIELAEHFRDLGFTKGAEIGVADGRYAEILCATIPGLEYYGIDVWAKYDGNWRSDEYQDKAFAEATEKISQYIRSGKAFLIKNTSLSASLAFKDDSLDFVFIDGAHDFDNVMLDIIIWSKKVKKGGIVAGHDYYQFNGGVIPAVNAYIEAHKIDLNLTLKDESGHKDDVCPCWWFIKR